MADTLSVVKIKTIFNHNFNFNVLKIKESLQIKDQYNLKFDILRSSHDRKQLESNFLAVIKT